MEIKPVKGIEKPKYPQKDEVDIDEVKKSIPKRWASSPAAKIALGTLAIVSLAGCVSDPPMGTPAPPIPTTEETVSPEETYYQTAGVPMAPAVNVAPLFIHGEGRGAFGGDMVGTSAFISEDEALGIINEAASEYGLKFSSGASPEFAGVPQPVTNILDPENNEPSNKVMAFKADFADSGRGIVIEFVSKEDVEKWSKEAGPSTYMQYYTRDAAEQLSEGLEQADVSGGYYTAAVLYDPCEVSESPDKNPLSEEQLKTQAKDFFEWLKTRGVI